MAKSASENEPQGVPEQNPPQPAAQAQQPAQQAQMQMQIDDTRALTSYANFCRVTGTPEEMIVDFGLSKNPMGPTSERIEITQRLIVNFYTAKRLLGVLQMAIQRHEAAFGVLETDIQRRVRPDAFREARG